MLMKDWSWMSSVEIKCTLSAGWYPRSLLEAEKMHFKKDEHQAFLFFSLSGDFMRENRFCIHSFIYLSVNVFSSSVFVFQWRVARSLENLHPSSSPTRGRKETPYSLHIWKVKCFITLRKKIKVNYPSQVFFFFFSFASHFLVSTVVDLVKQTILWRKWDSNMREHTSGCSPSQPDASFVAHINSHTDENVCMKL